MSHLYVNPYLPLTWPYFVEYTANLSVLHAFSYRSPSWDVFVIAVAAAVQSCCFLGPSTSITDNKGSSSEHQLIGALSGLGAFALIILTLLGWGVFTRMVKKKYRSSSDGVTQPGDIELLGTNWKLQDPRGF